MQVFTDAAWAVGEPLIEEVRPRGETPPQDPRRTIAAIFGRHRNGAEWRAIPAELGPWWRAAQPFLRRARLGVLWERPLDSARRRGVTPGMAFRDGTHIRAHAKAAGAAKRGPTARGATGVRRSAAHAAATAPGRA